MPLDWDDGTLSTIKQEARDTWLEMNGRRGIEKGCLLVSMAIGPRTAIVNVLTVLETQNLEPKRTILFSTGWTIMSSTS